MFSMFLITFVVFVLVIFAMSIGYWIQQKTISGSCGGIASLGIDKVCSCPEPCEKRKAKMARQASREQVLEKRRALQQALRSENRIL